MTRAARTARYTLPDVVDPTDTVCFTVPVPNDKFHIAAFKGQIKALGSAYTWGNDSAHTALDVAAVWRAIFDNLENCEVVNIRLKPTDFCTLQLTVDGGVTWTDVADLSDCAHAAAVDEIGLARDRGELQGGGQQPGQGSGLPGVCYDYYLTLHATDRWHSPVAVVDGDTITVDTIDGAWWDGNVLGGWYCPDGSGFVLGVCAGSPITDSSDPLPTLGHMRLIGNLPADSTTPYFDMYNTIYTVPSGVALGEFYLLPNDHDLPDNQGSINLHVRICKGGWHHCFLGGAGLGAVIVPVTLFGHTAGTYNSGTDYIDSTVINIFGDTWAPAELDFAGTITDIFFSIRWDNSDPVTGYGIYADGTALIEGLIPTGTGDQVIEWHGSQTVTTKLQFLTSGLPHANITGIKIYGIDATPPFGADNC